MHSVRVVAITFAVVGALACPSDDDGASGESGSSSGGGASSSSSSTTPPTDDSSSSGGAGSSSEDGVVDPSSGAAGSSSSTGPIDYPPPVGYGDCKNIPTSAACLDEEGCVEIGESAVCMRAACEDSFDCPAMPKTGTAPVVCMDVADELDGLECYLLCSGMQTCPDGMSCESGVCTWPLFR